MNSFKRYFSKRRNSQKGLKRLLENISDQQIESYFSGTVQLKTNIADLIPVETKVKWDEFIGRDQQEQVLSYLSNSWEEQYKFDIKQLQPTEESYDFDVFFTSQYQRDLTAKPETKLYSSLCYIIRDEVATEVLTSCIAKFSNGIQRKIFLLSRHLDHELKEACANFVINKRAKFMTDRKSVV